AEARDHPGTEIFLDGLDGCRRRGAHEARLKLLAMGSVVDPLARRCDPLAGGDHRGVPDDGDQFAVATRLDAQNAKAVLSVVEGDALDKARQNLPGQRFQLGLWRAAHEVPRSVSPTCHAAGPRY